MGTVGYIWEKLSKFMISFGRVSFPQLIKKIIIRISACMENMSHPLTIYLLGL